MVRHFLDISDFEVAELTAILDNAIKLKSGHNDKPLADKQLAMIFEKPSTRTRVSFEVGINQLGGDAVLLASSDSQLGRGESIADTAKVLSRYVDIIMIRTFRHETLLELAENSDVPVINGLTNISHPCQVMADIMTIIEHKGDIQNKVITWIGDCNNMAGSWIHAAEKFGFELRLACPEELAPPSGLPQNVRLLHDPMRAAEGADCITTDTWVSMGDADAEEKRQILEPFQVNDGIMKQAADDAIFLHCLPAHRGEEVTASVIDGAQSVVFDEAENRLHIQKAIMLWCMGK